MKLFLIGLGHMRREQIDVARALSKNHTIQYWVRMREHFAIDESAFQGTIFHEYKDALAGLPAPGIDVGQFDPPSREVLEHYAAIESEFMTMVDKWHPDWSVNHRKDLFVDMLCYWSGVLEKFKPECIIIPVIPHEMYSFVLYALARKRGIRTLILDAILENDYYVLVEDYKKGNETLVQALALKSNAQLSDLSEAMRAYYERVSKGENPAPKAMSDFMAHENIAGNLRRESYAIAKFIRDGTLFERAVKKIFKLLHADLADEYHAHERAADLKKEFVYFPLHYQPEATTSPQGGVYVNQLLAIKTLAYALPADWEIYVKEHPAQMAVHGGNTTPARYRGYYAAIAAISRVRLVPISTNTFQLTDRARATATITGTAAWESILRGRCAIAFGYPWFMYAPGIFRIESVEDCRRALRSISEGAKPEQADVIAYLSVLDRIRLRGYLQVKTPGYEDQWPQMHRAIEEQLRMQ
jgi:hypothetical protein